MYQHIATHCNTLQHTATHCNTLQHTATHCNNVCVYILWITCMRSTKKLPRNGPTWSIEYFFYIHIHTRVAARNSNCCDRKRYYWWNIHIQKYLHTHSQRSNNECCERNRHFWWICIIHHTYTPTHTHLTALHIVAVCCSVLQCVAMCCSVLQCVAVCCSGLHGRSATKLKCVAMCCNVLQCAAVCCRVLQCVAACCSVLHWRDVAFHYAAGLHGGSATKFKRKGGAWGKRRRNNLCRWVSMCCSVLQCVALCCNVLQYVAVCCSEMMIRPICICIWDLCGTYIWDFAYGK